MTGEGKATVQTTMKVLAVCFGLSLLAAACGDDDESSGDNNEPAAVDTQPVVEPTEPADAGPEESSEAEEPSEGVDETGGEEAQSEETADGADGEGGVIGFAYGLENVPIYQNVLAPALAEAERSGFEIVEGAAAGNCEAQLADIDNMIASGVDAVVVLNLCPEGYDAQIAAAQAAGAAFVAYLWDHPDVDGKILLADGVPGELISDRAIEWIDNEYDGALEDFAWILHGCSFAPPGIQLRTEIPKERITAHTGVEPIETVCALDPQSSLDATLEILQAEPGINMAIGLTESAALGSYSAFEQADGFDTSNVFLAGVDGELPAVELIADGGGTGGMYTMSAALDLEAVGFAVVRVSKAAIEGDTANTIFQTRHVPLSIDDTDAAAAWFDRVFSAYAG